MVLTRPKIAINYKEPSDDEMEELGGPGNGVMQDRSLGIGDRTKPKRKRARTTRNTREGNRSENSRKSRLGDPFTSLPLDMVYEIFGYLTPLDLLHLARTNKVLRAHLTSKRSISAWKAARAVATPPVPICPKGLSEPQLAVLLFTKECTICSKRLKFAEIHWWILQLRVCKSCFDSTVISGKAAAQQCSYLDDFRTVLEILPGESMWRRSRRRSDPSEDYYRLEDIHQMTDIVEHYQLRLEARVEGATADFEQFIENTKSEVSERLESAKALFEWALETNRAERAMRMQIRQARKQEISSKLVDLGHDLRDIQEAFYQNSWIPNLFSSTKPLTTTSWKRIRLEAERLVEEQNRLRLEREEDPIRKDRREVFRQGYHSFRSSYNAPPDTFMPSDKSLMKLPAFKEAIEAEGTSISPSIFDKAFSELPDYLNRWRKERRLGLVRIILEAQSEPDADIDPETADEQGILSLATSVLATCGQAYLSKHEEDTVHWMDSIGEHFPKKVFHTPSSRKSKASHEEMQCIRVVRDWVDTVKLLVRAVELDPDTATAEEMDAIDARFYCDECSVVRLRNEMVARNWRNCIKHLGFHSKSSPSKGFTLLTSEDRAVIDTHEKKVEKSFRTSATWWKDSAMSLNGKRINLRGYGARYRIMSCFRGRWPTSSADSD